MTEQDIHFPGNVPDADAGDWIADDASLCKLPPGIYEVVYRRATFRYNTASGPNKSNYDLTNEICVGILAPANHRYANPEVLKNTTCSYNLAMVPRQAGNPCRSEFSINYVPSSNLQYYSSFIIAVRPIKKDSATYAELLRCLSAKSNYLPRTALSIVENAV